MNRSEAKNLLDNMEFVKAFANGQDIQFVCYVGDDDWSDLDDPCFMDYPKEHYRIKPRPIEGWANVYKASQAVVLHPTKAQADSQALPSRVACVFMRQVEGK